MLQGMWTLPGPGVGPVFPVLAGRFLSTVPPGKSPTGFLSTVLAPPKTLTPLYEFYNQYNKFLKMSYWELD